MGTKPVKHSSPKNEVLKSVSASPSQMGPEVLLSQCLQGKITISESQLTMTVPPPSVMAEYISYYPEAPQTFFRWSEEEATHRRKLDEAMITSQIRDSRLGMWLGFIVALCGLGVAAFSAWWGQPWVAAILGGGTIVSLATAFIRGRTFPRRSPKPERKK